jgi:hypothetical protein
MKIERLAGIRGKPEAQMMYGNEWVVSQFDSRSCGEIYGPIKKSETDAIKAWNVMVRRIRKLNSGERP